MYESCEVSICIYTLAFRLSTLRTQWRPRWMFTCAIHERRIDALGIIFANVQTEKHPFKSAPEPSLPPIIHTHTHTAVTTLSVPRVWVYWLKISSRAPCNAARATLHVCVVPILDIATRCIFYIICSLQCGDNVPRCDYTLQLHPAAMQIISPHTAFHGPLCKSFSPWRTCSTPLLHFLCEGHHSDAHFILFSLSA